MQQHSQETYNQILRLRKDGYSFGQISKALQINKSTISYIVKRLQLPVTYPKALDIEKTALQKLIKKRYTIKQMAESLNCSATTVGKYLKKYKLKTLRVRKAKVYCVVCKRSTRNSTHKSKCYACASRVSRYRAKLKAVAYKGGKCMKCGWSGNIAALEFHHIEGENKEFGIGQKVNANWEKVKNELDKCELLCSNCHRSLHADNRDPKFLKAVFTDYNIPTIMDI